MSEAGLNGVGQVYGMDLLDPEALAFVIEYNNLEQTQAFLRNYRSQATPKELLSSCRDLFFRDPQLQEKLEQFLREWVKRRFREDFKGQSTTEELEEFASEHLSSGFLAYFRNLSQNESNPDTCNYIYAQLASSGVFPDFLSSVYQKTEKQVDDYFATLQRSPDGKTTVANKRYLLFRANSISIDLQRVIWEGNFSFVGDSFRERSNEKSCWFACSLLSDLAHTMGRAAAQSLFEQTNIKDPLERLCAGLVSSSHTGWAFLNLLPESRPTLDDDFFLVCHPKFNIESTAWYRLETKEPSNGCLLTCGYIAGWCQECFDRKLVAKEVTCRTMGDTYCCFVVAPPHRLEVHVQRYKEILEVSRPYKLLSFLLREDSQDRWVYNSDTKSTSRNSEDIISASSPPRLGSVANKDLVSSSQSDLQPLGNKTKDEDLYVLNKSSPETRARGRTNPNLVYRDTLTNHLNSLAEKYFSRLESHLSIGALSIENEGYLLVRAQGISTNFFKLTKSFFGPSREEIGTLFASKFLFEFGRATGKIDCDHYVKEFNLSDKHPLEQLTGFPVILSQMGFGQVQILPSSNITISERNLLVVFEVANSFESDEWLEEEEINRPKFPTCVALAGFALGWSERSIGIGMKLAVAEVFCRSLGDACCRFIVAHPDVIESRVQSVLEANGKLDRLSAITTLRVLKLHNQKAKTTAISYSELHEAVTDNDINRAKKLLKKGYDVNIRDENQQTPLHLACNHLNYEMVRILTDRRWNPQFDIQDRLGWTPLHFACFHGRLDICLELIDKGATLNGVTNDGDNPLHYLVRINVEKDKEAFYEKVLVRMLNKGLDINKRNANGESPLFIAASKGHTFIVSLLLVHKADPNTLSKFGETSLHAAARGGHLDVVQLLYEAGANPDIIGKHGSFRDVTHRAEIKDLQVSISNYLKRTTSAREKDAKYTPPLLPAKPLPVPPSSRDSFQVSTPKSSPKQAHILLREQSKKQLPPSPSTPTTSPLGQFTTPGFVTQNPLPKIPSQRPPLPHHSSHPILLRHPLASTGAPPLMAQPQSIKQLQPTLSQLQLNRRPVYSSQSGSASPLLQPLNKTPAIPDPSQPSSMSSLNKDSVKNIMYTDDKPGSQRKSNDSIGETPPFRPFSFPRGAFEQNQHQSFMYMAPNSQEFMGYYGVPLPQQPSTQYPFILPQHSTPQPGIPLHNQHMTNSPPLSQLPAAYAPLTSSGFQIDLLKQIIKAGTCPTALHELAKQPNHEEVLKAFEASLDFLFPFHISMQDQYGCTPLHYAARAGNLALFERLHAYGANPTVVDSFGLTPYQILLHCGIQVDEKFSRPIDMNRA